MILKLSAKSEYQPLKHQPLKKRTKKARIITVRAFALNVLEEILFNQSHISFIIVFGVVRTLGVNSVIVCTYINRLATKGSIPFVVDIMTGV